MSPDRRRAQLPSHGRPIQLPATGSAESVMDRRATWWLRPSALTFLVRLLVLVLHCR